MIETNEGSPKATCIGEFLGKRFFIPFYQRGYRWEAPQVKLLLEDIKVNTEGARKYSLQPIVVASKKSEEGEQWGLIDGQQRLTTLIPEAEHAAIVAELRINLNPPHQQSHSH